MEQNKIRNVAIIAHVDHGKTTLVDNFFKQTGMFRDNQVVEERLMDSMELEKEKGITIASKNGAFFYKDYMFNVIDTPGHADFGGQVERVLRMADGALLLVDAVDGPMPQTYFVLKKALESHLKVILVINKIDRPERRCEWVVNEVFDLFVRLNAPDDILDFPIVYASAKEGYATKDPDQKTNNMNYLLDTIIEHIPAPKGDPNGPLQLQVSSIGYSSFLGRLGIGKITSGKIKVNDQVLVAIPHKDPVQVRITNLYRFRLMEKLEIESASVGEIVAVAGMEDVKIGMTYTDLEHPIPLPEIKLDPPTISMNFVGNDSPFYGKDGKYVTSRQIGERLMKETLSDVSLEVEEIPGTYAYKVSGRGELHLSILIEKIRREGYEFQVTRPEVIFREENGKKLEPYEELTIDVDDQYAGAVIRDVGMRKGQLIQMSQQNGVTHLKYRIPTRGLLGFRAEFMTESKGKGVMNYIFSGYGEYMGPIKNRKKGVIISGYDCTVTTYAMVNLQDRGKFFVDVGEKVYEGQIIGEHCRENDIIVNPGKARRLNNFRAAHADETVCLEPPTKMFLEQCLSYINDDEMVEITPKCVRLRKIILKDIDRRRARRQTVAEVVD